MQHATLHIQHTLLPSQFEAFNAEFITGKGENFAAPLARERWGEGKAQLQRVNFSNLLPGGCVKLPPFPASLAQNSLPQSLETGRREAQLGPTTVTPERCVAVPPLLLLLSLLSPGSRVGPQRPTLRRQTRRRWKPRNARRREMRRDRRSRCSRRNTAN